MKTEYKNIPQTGFSSLSPEFKTEMVYVSMRSRDTITLSLFSVWQIISGLNNMVEVIAITGAKHLGDKSIQIMQVAGKLFRAAMDHKTGASQVGIEVTRDDVKQMVELLNIRMMHCEKERDNGSERFNPDTYIGQKLLLIELREWLLLEAVEVPVVRKSEPVGSD